MLSDHLQDDMIIMLNRACRTRVTADLQEHYKTTEHSTVRFATHTEYRYQLAQYVTEVTAFHLFTLRWLNFRSRYYWCLHILSTRMNAEN